MAETPVTAGELEAARTKFIESLPVQFETAGAIAGYILAVVIAEPGWSLLEQSLEAAAVVLMIASLIVYARRFLDVVRGS